ncbi:hypothetical protein BTZ20_2439 [Rhodococcus sp. MTM3W5.2]|uniref:phage shock envelope stress response protein PspM n=1 Tax=Rhodococcus sp. MTM3W5.2 TaxID=1805827 RepID=UPI000979063E|nr:hypothetical protein [Rhodococcus sp. MTM3W5.2]AQA24756.1 hypothetical protein BTZ20_2439 [Rhodococcus sp. MTM3W5.2]
MTSSRRGRAGSDSRSAAAFFTAAANGASGVVAATEAARTMSGTVASAVRKWSDPRAKLLRRRRRANRRRMRYGTVSGASAVGTVGLAAASAPEWSLIVGGGATALFAVPAVAAWRTYRRLNEIPLPARAPARRALPPVGSAAREPVGRLLGAQTGLQELLGVLTRSAVVAEEDIEQIGDTAASAAEALFAVADDVIAMERAGSTTAGLQLGGAIEATAARLSAGVEQYEELLASVAKMTVPATADSLGALERQRSEMLSASDRLEGLAGALEEIEAIRRRHRA